MDEKLNQILKNQVIIMRALGNLGVGSSAAEALDTRMFETATLLSREESEESDESLETD